MVGILVLDCPHKVPGLDVELVNDYRSTPMPATTTPALDLEDSVIEISEQDLAVAAEILHG
jgi:hypothetical protein